MEFLIVYLIFAAIPPIVAVNKGRSGVAWFFIGLLISPVLALIILLVISEGGLPIVISAQPVRPDWEHQPAARWVAGYNFRGAPIDEYDDGTFRIQLPDGWRSFNSRDALNSFLREHR